MSVLPDHYSNSVHADRPQLLYNVKVLFPTADIAQVSTRQQYTLSPGQYEYPFSFKVRKVSAATCRMALAI